jgi:Fe-S-cluster containining protein
MTGKQDGIWAEHSITLRMGEASRSVRLKVTMKEQRPVDLLPVLQLFQNEIVSVSEDAVRSQGKSISCRAGCGACCRQLVPVSDIEARHIAGVVAKLPPKRRKEVRRRFKSARKSLDEAGLVKRSLSGWKSDDASVREQLGLDYFQAGVACPFLEEESCSIHPDRPLSCREFLVTSPAENCENPNPTGIDSVDLPARLSYLAYRFSDGRGKADAHWLPLTLALDWHEQHKEDHQPMLPGHEMLRTVLEEVAKG